MSDHGTRWSRRFLDVLESFGMGDRLRGGRRAARAGEVLSMSLSTSLVVARVQDPQDRSGEPHRVRIALRAFSDNDWDRVAKALAGQAFYAAKLLAGELPADVETVFAKLGLALFPESQRELSMDCSCPGWEVPCRHLAATCHLLAESFDTDPFAILAWRGRGREELLDRLREMRDRSANQRPEPDPAGPPLTECLDTFWTARPVEAIEPSGLTGRAAPDAVLDRLDPLPVTLRRHDLVDLLRPAYRAIVRPET